MNSSDFFHVVSRLARALFVVHRRGLILGAFVMLVICGSCVRTIAPPPGPDIPATVQQQGFRGTQQKEEIIRWLAEYAVAEQQYSDIPASITIAQAILETGWLKTDKPISRRMIYDAKNLFGIKGAGPAGFIEIPTSEVENGQTITVMAKFRAYNTYRESFADHTRLLLTSHYYKDALPYRSDARRYIAEVAKKYATDPRYADKIWKIVEDYNLTRFDKTPAPAALR